MGMVKRRWWCQRLPLWCCSVTAIATYATVWMLFSQEKVPSTESTRDPLSPCRPDMEVNMLPPMSDDFNTMVKDLFTYLTQPNKKACRKVLSFGGMAMLMNNEISFRDGHKRVCMDRELTMLSTDNCLVYSFGISDDWSFDLDVGSYGCTVYAFDPSINKTTGWQTGNIMFLQYGIGDQDLRTPDGWELRTLDSFVDQLHHANRTIQYLKVDVESAEWAMLRQQLTHADRSVLARNVEQIGMELHFLYTAPRPEHTLFYIRVYQSFLMLQQLGFYLFSYEPNLGQPASMIVPGLRENLTSAMEVVWFKSRCVDASSGRAKGQVGVS